MTYSLDDLIDSGVEMWGVSYREAPGDRDALVCAMRHGRAHRPLMEVLHDHAMGSLAMGLAKWVHVGCPRVIPHGHKYAAALMCTALSREVPLRAPWETFVVDVPDRLISVNDGAGRTGWITRAVVYIFESTDIGGAALPADDPERVRWSIMGLADNGIALWETGLTVAHVTNDQQSTLKEYASPFSNIPPEDADARASLLLRRYIVGISIDMIAQLEARAASRDSRPRSAVVATRSATETAPPELRNFKAGRALDIDCRETVRRFGCGERAAPSVNWMVVGHFRNQAHGPGRVQRRLIWIQPHWGNNKAGTSAPVALRPHKTAPAAADGGAP